MMLSILYLHFAFIFGVVFGHGIVSTPTPRQLGAAALSACGQGAYKVLSSDKYGPIENAVNKVDSGYNAAACHLYFCKGTQFSDNSANVKSYKTGESVHFLVDIEAHHTGYANVSIVDLKSQAMIGKPLFNWPVYANNSLGPPQWVKNETDFSVTIPDLGTRCKTAGSCAIQWFWYAFNKQTYESCIDFVTV